MRSKYIFIGTLMMLLVLSVSGVTRAQDEGEFLQFSQNNPKLTIVCIGLSQLGFQSINNEHVFGTFEELQEDLFIQDNYTYSTIVENYELRFYMEPDRTGFTVIAMPVVEAEPPLEIFMIDETVTTYWLEPTEDPGNHIPNPPGEIRTRIDESPQLEAPESITVYFEPMDNWTHNLHARYIYIESMDQWYIAKVNYYGPSGFRVGKNDVFTGSKDCFRG